MTHDDSWAEDDAAWRKIMRDGVIDAVLLAIALILVVVMVSP